MISNHRETAPPGLNGASAGKLGCNQLKLTSGEIKTLPACFEETVTPGMQVIIKTPGGGGYNIPNSPEIPQAEKN